LKIESLNDVWAAVKEFCLERITEVAYNCWLKDLHPIELRRGEFVMGIDNEYKKGIIEDNYSELLKDALKQIMGIDFEIIILIEDENGSVLTEEVADDFSFAACFTFENFIVGPTNRFAHAASFAIANNEESQTPLVIYGNSGVGKTHLLLAIKNHSLKFFPSKKVEYIRCEDFTNQMIASIKDGTIQEFRNKFRSVDVLLIDDIQFIAGKEQTQEEFFNTFNALYLNNKKIVVTMDRPPKEIKTLDDRIRSRFEGGLFADITPPDFETRVGIIRKKATELNLKIEDSIVFLIADHIKRNTRQLEGVVKNIKVYTQIQNENPTVSVVQEFIKKVVDDSTPEPVKIEKIISEVARSYNVSEADIYSNRKTSQLAMARQVAMYMVREMTDLSYKAIGEHFGRDHTTVLYNVNKIENFLKDKPYEKEMIENMIRNLQASQG
jgi:chromosomal replication initiator protein